MALQQAVLSPEALRNFKEFLEMYNKTTEQCFRQCVVNLHSRSVTDEEDRCLNDCTSKTASVNHRVLSAFMVEQPIIMQQKIDRAQKEAEFAMERMKEQGIDPDSLTPDDVAKKMMEGLQTQNSSTEQQQ